MEQLPLIVPESSWTPKAHFPSLQGERLLAIDTETRDPTLKTEGSCWPWRGGYVVGFSLATPTWRQYYPIRHQGGDNLPDADAALSWLRHELAQFEGTLVFMNALYDLGWLHAEGIRVSDRAIIRDVMFVEALIDENRYSYSLNAIAAAYKLERKDTALMNEAAAAYGYAKELSANIWRLPARFVGPYAERDADLPLRIWMRQKITIDEQNLQGVVELEHDLLAPLIDMRARGVRIDLDRAEQAQKLFLGKHQENIDEIARLSGHRIGSVYAAEDVARAFDRVGVSYPRTGKTGAPSFKKDWLETVQHPVGHAVVAARRYLKAANDFCGAMLLDRHKNGRVHCQFHPLRSDDGGAVSGRFASSDPNLQQVPARDPEIGPLIRSCFLPEEGELWCASDYSQQEPRLTVHYANIRGFSGAADAAERYTNDPTMDYHAMMAEITGLPRKQAKNIFLGLAYGEGGAKLCAQLGLPTEWRESKSGARWEVAGPEGQAILDEFDRRAPFVRQLSDECSRVAQSRGFVKTLSGRRRRFEMWEPIRGKATAAPHDIACERHGSDNVRRAFTHKALNAIIQGGSADMTKYAIRDLYRAGLRILVTVHDENGVSVPDEKTARLVGEIMENAVKLSVPFKCDVDVGPSWGEAKPIGAA